MAYKSEFSCALAMGGLSRRAFLLLLLGGDLDRAKQFQFHQIDICGHQEVIFLSFVSFKAFSHPSFCEMTFIDGDCADVTSCELFCTTLFRFLLDFLINQFLFNSLCFE